MNRGIVGAIALASLTLLIVMAALLLFSSSMVLASAVTDENLTTTVTVSAVAPSVGAITCESPTGTSSLTPVIGSNTTIRCYATITNLNGWGAIDKPGLNATLWIGGQFTNVDDFNNHYSNGTASYRGTNCCWGDACSNIGSGNTIVVSCNFTTRYFIDAGTWTINMSINDSSNNRNSTTASYTVNAVLGLNTVDTSIAFGTAALSAEKNDTVLVENVCNQIIDLTLAETDAPGNLTCNGVGSGDILTDATDSGVRYNKTVTDVWAGMEKLTGANVNYEQWGQAYYNDTDGVSATGDGTQAATLYWTLRVPANGVSGTCTGTTRITVKIDA